MRRATLAVAFGALALTAVFVFQLFASPAEIPLVPHGAAPEVQAEAPATPAEPVLPVTRVTLYSSGVSYFQREGEVDGDARIDLAFPVKDVNDLLKSMVLQDLGGGTVSAASYDTSDSADRGPGNFAASLTDALSLPELLQNARGEKVEVQLHKDPTPLTGTLVGVEPGFKELLFSEGHWGQPRGPSQACCSGHPVIQEQPVTSYYHNGPGGRKILESEEGARVALATLAREPARLNLLTPQGLRSLPMTEVQRVRFVNPALDRELRRALEARAGARDVQKRVVSLTFRGRGKRKVRVGYVVESPLWRTSYRLLAGEGGKLFLQGWAVAENPTAEDWKDVHLSLVSGRPISFKMDLCQPLYLSRPTVQPEYYAGVQPQTHDGSLVKTPAIGALTGAAMGALTGAAIRNQQQLWQSAGQPLASAPMTPAAAPSPPPAGTGIPANAPAGGPANGQINLQRGVTPAATAAELGDFFQYEIRHPVSLPRQKSAMLPIVGKAIEGSRVSLYNPATHAKFPLLALKMKNTSGLHLMQGPVTVFEGSGYAGDAKLLDLRPGEERLISYAVDLGTEVEPLCSPSTPRLTSVRIHKGLLLTTTRAREAKTYSVRNRSGHDRTVLVEHPVRSEMRLVSKAKPVERTREVYRFEVKVPAGKTASLEVVEEQDLVGQVTLCGCEEHTLRHFLKTVSSSDAVKQAVEKALTLKAKLSATQRELTRLQGHLQEIANDQQRLRANLKEMPATAAAYKRYLEKFDRQETEIEKLQAQVRELQDVEARRRQEYEVYWGQVEVGPTPARGEPVAVPFTRPAPAAVPPPPVVRPTSYSIP
jgi:hypothetical protein